MADTAAFFAKKKKGGKKKAFKSFNANKIDAAAISSTVHVDAPAISGAASKALDLPTSANSNGVTTTHRKISSNESVLPSSAAATEEKDNDGLENQSTQNRANIVVQSKGAVTELLDMNALEERRREQDNVVERMRVEETKAALASARKGMEKEALRLKDVQNKKKTSDGSRVEPSDVGGSGGGLGSKGGKWVPMHRRSGPSPALGNSRMMMSKARGKSVMPDTGDAMDFPDLASANAAIEAQKKMEKERQEKDRQRVAAKAAGVKPWGASRSTINGTRKKIEVLPPSLSKSSKSSPVHVKLHPPSAFAPTTSSVDTVKAEKSVTADPQSAPVSTTPVAPIVSAPLSTTTAPVLKKKKKKKKDLSTFKSSA